MKVLLLTRTLPHGGAERQLVGLARGLRDRGHDVAVAVFYGGGPLERELAAAGIRLIDLQKGGRWDVLPFVVRSGWALRRERPDVVHGFLPMPNIIASLLRPMHGGRVIWGIRASNMELANYSWLDRVANSVERVLARRADLIISNSHAGKRDVVGRGFPRERTIVIPNGVDLVRFQRDEIGRKRVRAELGLSSETLLIGRIGRIDPQKDYPVFLRAAARIAAEEPRARFVVVGSGPDDYTVRMQALARQLGIDARVQWLGGRSDMAAIYSACDLTISSSAFGEGTPNAVAESHACGTPCVVTDIGDSALTAGDSRLVCEAGNAAALARTAIVTLDRLAAGEIDPRALRTHIADAFSFDNLIDRTEAALAATVSGATRVALKGASA